MRFPPALNAVRNERARINRDNSGCCRDLYEGSFYNDYSPEEEINCKFVSGICSIKSKDAGRLSRGSLMSYSLRRAFIGSTLEARRAGSNAASNPTAASIAVVVPRTIGLSAFTPKNSAVIR